MVTIDMTGVHITSVDMIITKGRRPSDRGIQIAISVSYTVYRPTKLYQGCSKEFLYTPFYHMHIYSHVMADMLFALFATLSESRPPAIK